VQFLDNPLWADAEHALVAWQKAFGVAEAVLVAARTRLVGEYQGGGRERGGPRPPGAVGKTPEGRRLNR